METRGSFTRKSTEEFICRAAMEKQTQRTELWKQGERRRERVRCMENGESNIEMYNNMYKIDSQWELAV